ncbi:preprotein translocase subunit YajC [Actinomadura alba]|uniref:preprotein translocase subunit YajC n=1 Tax=Actinomadura alba TaxID=406431 RepID=UPI0031E04E24
MQGDIVFLAAAEQQGNPLVFPLMIAAMIAAFYFLIIRPQNKRRRDQTQMQSSVQPGARVVTTSGMHATVVAVDDDGIVLEISPGVEARFIKQAIMQVVPDDDPDDEPEDVEDVEDETDETAGDDEAVKLGKDGDTGSEEDTADKRTEQSGSRAPGKPSA